MKNKIKLIIWKLLNSFPELTICHGYKGSTEQHLLVTGFIHDFKNGCYMSAIQGVTPKGFKEFIPQIWLDSYEPEDLPEEIVVECFALWGMSIYRERGKFHPLFVRFMRKMSKKLR